MLYIVKCPYPNKIGACEHGLKVNNTQHCYCGSWKFGKNNTVERKCENGNN